MKNEDKFLDEDDYPIINMKDEETGENIEFVVMDSIKVDGKNYFLVVESNDIYNDNVEALLLRQDLENENEITYSITQNDAEFEGVIHLLNESSDDYDIQI